jgi:hypothetical protein
VTVLFVEFHTLKLWKGGRVENGSMGCEVMWKKQIDIFFTGNSEIFCNAGKESRNDGPLTKYSKLCGQGKITVISLEDFYSLGRKSATLVVHSGWLVEAVCLE